MKIFKFLQKNKEVKGSSDFSRFFREASSGDRKKVFKEAARKASEDQKKIFYSDSSRVKTS